MPDLTLEQLTLALAVVAGVAILAIVIAIALGLRLKRIHANLAIMRGDEREVDVIAAIGRTQRRMSELDRRLDGVVAAVDERADQWRHAIQRFGIVRYDAFAEMGGQLSFSAAFLDEFGDGIVITSINGRTETRTYAKSIRKWDSEHNLSDEERRAISMAEAGEARSELSATR